MHTLLPSIYISVDSSNYIIQSTRLFADRDSVSSTTS